MTEPLGVIGFISTVMPAVALGNAVIAVPSERGALVATDLYQYSIPPTCRRASSTS